MLNKEKAITLFAELEKNHINLYHDISKQEFEKRKKEVLKNFDSLDLIHKYGAIRKLFALFKDAHTCFYFPTENIKLCVKNIGSKFYYFDTQEHICEEIKYVNGHKIDEVTKKLTELVCYECEPWLYNNLQYDLCNITMLETIDCGNSNKNIIEFKLKNGATKIKTKTDENEISQDNYSYSLDGNILKIKYLVCQNMPNYPFKNFLTDIKKQFATLPECCVIDLRDNGGGNDAILYPLINWLKENKIKTYALMNGGTFSSAVLNLIDLKYKCNATLIGTDAGQAAHGYGECGQIDFENGTMVTYCKKYFNQTTLDTHQPVKEFPIKKVVDYLGPIHPDIYLEEKVEDIKNGIDGQMRDALDIIKNTKNSIKKFTVQQ